MSTMKRTLPQGEFYDAFGHEPMSNLKATLAKVRERPELLELTDCNGSSIAVAVLLQHGGNASFHKAGDTAFAESLEFINWLMERKAPLIAMNPGAVAVVAMTTFNWAAKPYAAEMSELLNRFLKSGFLQANDSYSRTRNSKGDAIEPYDVTALRASIECGNHIAVGALMRAGADASRALAGTGHESLLSLAMEHADESTRNKMTATIIECEMAARLAASTAAEAAARLAARRRPPV